MSNKGFFSLPPEIRENIYAYLLSPSTIRSIIAVGDKTTRYLYAPSFNIFHVNRQIYYESRRIFRQLNTFVSIQTPWVNAVNHVALEGHVPIVAAGKRAEKFTHEHLRVEIDVVQTPAGYTKEIAKFIVRVEDLPLFTQMWFYSDLTYSNLNSTLRLNLHLRAPYAADFDEKYVSKVLQRRLLLPFGQIKGLNEVSISGDPMPLGSLQKEVKALMVEPYVTVEKCLEEATRLKDEGNVALKDGKYNDALELYNESWKAMHIVVRGHDREIHADAFFEQILNSKLFGVEHAQTVRLVLRVRLVANTVLAYVKLKDYKEAKFWGLRTIQIMRNGIGRVGMRPEDEAMTQFVAASEMGKIYYRTALACKELGEMGEALRLLKVAAVYLPYDKVVKEELAACAPDPVADFLGVRCQENVLETLFIYFCLIGVAGSLLFSRFS